MRINDLAPHLVGRVNQVGQAQTGDETQQADAGGGHFTEFAGIALAHTGDSHDDAAESRQSQQRSNHGKASHRAGERDTISIVRIAASGGNRKMLDLPAAALKLNEVRDFFMPHSLRPLISFSWATGLSSVAARPGFT